MARSKILSVLGMVLLLALAMPPLSLLEPDDARAAMQWEWETSVVDKGKEFDRPSMMIGPDAKIHIVYYGGDELYYATKNEGSWISATIDSQVSKYSLDLDVDLLGNPAIAYSSADKLKCAYLDGDSWIVGIVDGESKVGKLGSVCSLAFFSSGYPAIAYSDSADGNNLKYAYFNGTIWIVETLDSEGDIHGGSLAFSSSDIPVIVFTDSDNHTLKYAHRQGGSWNVDTVDSQVRTSSFALDPSGNPSISYYRYGEPGSGYDFKYAHLDGDSWIIETVDSSISGSIRYVAHSFDAQDNPGIAYDGDGYLKHAHRNESIWIVETVDGTVDENYSLAFDPLGNPAITFFYEGMFETRYAHFNGTSWDKFIVDGERGPTSLAFDSSGTPFVAYYCYGEGDIRCASLNGQSWDIEIVDSEGDFGDYGTSLAFDSSGNPAISYHHSYHKDDLKYAHFNGTSWDIMTVDDGGTYSSLAFDPTGNPAISYCQSLGSALKYAHFNGTSWDVVTVDDGEGWGVSHTSLAFDPSGDPAIAYHHGLDNDLRYAHLEGDSWSIDTVDGDTYVGQYASLAFDLLGNPAISYYDAINEDVKYAHFDGSSWVIETVDSEGDVGEYSSLAFDASGNPAICYRCYVRGGYNPITGLSSFSLFLRYACFDGNAWQIETVDGSGKGGDHCYLAFDQAGIPSISYAKYDSLDMGYAGLWYAYKDESGWHQQIVDQGGNKCGIYSSLAFAPSDAPSISYFDEPNGDLKFATGTPQPTPNQAPIVDAGADQMITLPASAVLDGTVTDDGLPSGSLTYAWSKISGSGTVTFGDADAESTSASFSEAGTYIMRLTADDGELSAYDEVTITIEGLAEPGNVPTIVEVNPNSGEPGESLQVTIIGAGLTGATDVDFGSGITVTDFDVDSPDQITAHISIDEDAALGWRTVSVTTPEGTGILEEGFDVEDNDSGLPGWVWVLVVVGGLLAMAVLFAGGIMVLRRLV